VQMLRAYFGEPEGDKCGLCDSCAGLDSEVFDPGEDDARHGLHAATDFHARPRRRRRGRPGYEAPGMPAAVVPAAAAAPPPPVFETAIPTDLLPPLPEFEVPPPPPGADTFDEGVWMTADLSGEVLPGEVVIDPADDWAAPPSLEAAAAADDDAPPSTDGVLPPDADNVEARWAAARDANIRPYLHWRPATPVTLPVLTVRPNASGQQQRPPHAHNNQPPQHAGHHGQPRGGRPGFNGKGPFNGGGGGAGGGGRRRRGRDRDQRRGGGEFNRSRERGPRLPGFYNPGGD
jgi:hypothetical protein